MLPTGWHRRRMEVPNRRAEKPLIQNLNVFRATRMLANMWHAASLAAALVLISANAVSAAPNIAHFTLPNGMEVVVIPDHRTPVVTHMVWYKVGSADEQPGVSGIAHFLEHLMFKGTEKNPAGRFSQLVANLGGQENAFTSNDYTGYFQRVPKAELGKVMDFEADRMTGLVLTDAVVAPELLVVLEEQNQRVANNPGARLGEEMNAALYRNHPYGKPVIGWRHEIEQLGRTQALEFYKRFYAPNNAALVIAGDVTADEVRELALKTYGKVARGPDLGPRRRPQEPASEAPRTATLTDPRVTDPSVQRSYLVPSYATAKPGEAEALDVLAQILGSGSNSRLYRSLVIDKGLAVSAGGWYQGTALDQTKFGVYGSARPGVELAKVEAEIDAVIGTVAAEGITDDELSVARTKLISEAVYAQDSQAALARWYGAAITSGMTVEKTQTWTDRIAKVTADEVRDAARNWLDKRRSVTGYLLKGNAKPAEKRS
jgi:zinc protease